MGTALEEFLNDFEALFGGEAREDPEEEVTTGQVSAYPVSDPSVPGSSQNEILLVGNSGAPSDLVLGSPRVPGTVSSDKFKPETFKEIQDNTNTNDNHDNTNFNKSKVYNTGHRNGYSPDVDIDLNSSEDEFNGQVFKRLDDLRDSVCLSSHRNGNSSQKARIGQIPIPRPCAHCPLIIGSRALMRQHIQVKHQDILLTRRRSRPDME